MLKRVTGRRTNRSGLEWPKESAPQDQLFLPRAPLRKLLVMVDTEIEKVLAPDVPILESLDQRVLVTDLLKHKYIVGYRYADGGPPEGTGGSRVGEVPEPSYPGWAISEEVETPEGIQVGVRYSQSSSGVAWGGRPENRLVIAERDEHTGAYEAMTLEEAKARRRADARAYLAAETIGVDLFITHRDYLLRSNQYSSDGVAVCGPEEALAFIGLYLRTQGEFQILSDFRFNRGLFYLAGTHQLLSSGHRWRRAIGQYTEGSGDEELQRIAWSLVERIDRALEERDRFNATLNRKQDNDVRDSALLLLDTILLWFMSAFDIAARVANRTLALNVKDRNAGWQNTQWLEKVEYQCPALAAAVGPNTTGQHVLTIVRLLRNSVHGAALQGAAYLNNNGPQQTIIGLPAEDESELLLAMDAEGGRDRWGVVLEIPGHRVQLDPGLFVETAFRSVVSLLNELMDATPVETLPYVDLNSPEPLFPGGPSRNPFSPEIGQSIRWQLGL